MRNSSINTFYIIFEFGTFALFYYLYDAWWVAIIAAIGAPIIVGLLNGYWRSLSPRNQMYPAFFVIWFLTLLACYLSKTIF